MLVRDSPAAGHDLTSTMRWVGGALSVQNYSRLCRLQCATSDLSIQPLVTLSAQHRLRMKDTAIRWAQQHRNRLLRMMGERIVAREEGKPTTTQTMSYNIGWTVQQVDQRVVVHNDGWQQVACYHWATPSWWALGDWSQCEVLHTYATKEIRDPMLSRAADVQTRRQRLRHQQSVGAVSYKPPPQRWCLPGSHSWARTSRKQARGEEGESKDERTAP